LANRIDETLGRLRADGATAVVPFVTIGFPDVETSESLVEALVDSGADMIELGVPFSDPLADGPTIQMTSFRALGNGVTVAASLDLVSRLRANGADTPLIFMGYYNPFLQFGTERLAAAAEDASLDGIIDPDLPTEEATAFGETCERHGIYLIPLLAPTSTDQRIERACNQASGFIYCVSLTGVTGARRSLSGGIGDLVTRIRRHTDLPVLVGFGVSKREHVEEIGRYADGAVVASAMLDAVDKAPEGRKVETAAAFLQGLKGPGSVSRP
jgi:tryptophan synthase alpha chain